MNPAPDPQPPEATPAVAPTQTMPPVAPTATAPPVAELPPVTRPPTGAAPKLFLAVTALALVAWLAWLSITAMNKSREPIVSRAQASLAPLAVVATVKVGKDGKPDANVVVVKTPGREKPLEGKLLVTNLPSARGFEGDGEYLLLLAPELFAMDSEPMYQLVVFRTTSTDTDPPVIYKWSPDVEKQAERLYRDRK